MPNKDKTGPERKGPKTGKQLGNCEGAEPNETAPRNEAGRRPRRNLGRGLGRGRQDA
ncbi:DUF5320 domain-containing protein [Candidatus Pacearchaeota archaeon]|nr:DUF5320 domain-containing protein [Candidatus Pacearchaeota archaeon]